ncbi:hypothetical protein [Rhodospirillaceae bacterium SYSU D60014]|uniref:hypothetical protein n=1 Tax=Virgifigura deserti TaxID=2268457 RepID=UPI000E675D8A
MSVVKSTAVCARYMAGFVLLICAATALNVGIVLGWSYLSPDSLNQSLAVAVDSIDYDRDGNTILWKSASAASQKDL